MAIYTESAEMLTENQATHLLLMGQMEQLRDHEDVLRQQLRESWLRLSSAEKASLLPPVMPVPTRCVR